MLILVMSLFIYTGDVSCYISPFGMHIFLDKVDKVVVCSAVLDQDSSWNMI